MRITSGRHPWYFLVHPSTVEPGRWQLTRMEGDEPTGHTTWNTREEAVASACGRRVRGQIPVGDKTFQVLEKPLRCQAQVWRKDTYRRTGRGRNGFEMHYNRGRCKRAACDGILCRQHFQRRQQGANVTLAPEDWMS